MRALSEGQRRLLETVSGRLAPGFEALSEAQRSAALQIIDETLMSRPAGLRRQFALFLAAVRWLPVLRFGAPLERLEPGRRDAALRWLEDCPIALLRKGFWGLKSLVYMGYYGQCELWPHLGYAPARDGNSRLGRR